MTSPLIIPLNYIERKPESDYYRIVGKGITVEFLSRLIDDPEWTLDRICENYNLTPAEVHAAWAFYYAHQSEIDQRLEAAAERFASSSEDDTRKRAAMLLRKSS
jgi:uncharacterized protein (DUF433 family)